MTERNALCWCGSGKKYKLCHLAFDEHIAGMKFNFFRGQVRPPKKIINNEKDIEGIRKSGVVNAAVEVAGETVEKLNKKLDINSPSKVTMAIGGSMDEGLAKGLLKYSYLADQAGGNVVDNAIDNMSDSINKISLLANSDLDISPVITPIIDSTMVESGIANINSMFSEQQALKVAMTAESSNIESDVKELIQLNKAMLSAIKGGGDIYLNENLIIGRINRRLGAL